MTGTVYDALFQHAGVAAEQAEVEAANLRIELRQAHETIIRTKLVGWRHALAGLNFYARELHKRDGMSDAELLEDVQVIAGMGCGIVGEIARYRRRWGATPPVMDELRLGRVLARELLRKVRPIHRRVRWTCGGSDRLGILGLGI